MKRLMLIIFAAAALLSSCDEVEMENNAKAIRFGGVETRAEVTGADQVLGFKVCAEMNLGPENAEDGSDLQWIPLLEDERVYRSNSTSPFEYDNIRFWINNRKYYFYGVYPESVSVTRYGLENGWVYNSTIEVPYAADMDLMTAISDVTVGDETEFEPVKMNLKHHFSRVKFKICKNNVNKDDTFTVTEIGISGISRSANLILMYNPGSTYAPTLTPNSDIGSVLRRNLNEEIALGEWDADNKLVGGTTLLENNGLLLIPQEITNGQASLNISFTYKQKEATEVEYQTISKPLPGGYAWEANKTYVYTLELKDDKNIYISTPTVEGWGTSQPGGFIIIN